MREAAGLDELDSEEHTPLLHACEGGQLAIVKLLVEAGASLTETDEDCRNILHLSSINGHAHIVRYLLGFPAMREAATLDGQETLQTGKREVGLTALEPVGNYVVRPVFSDSHDTGIFNWDYLYWLGSSADALWEDYLRWLEAAGFTRDSGRDAPMVVAGGGCASH